MVATCGIDFTCHKGIPKESTAACTKNKCTASDCCTLTCDGHPCPADKNVSPGTACLTSGGCTDDICCVTPQAGNAAAQATRSATQKLCETKLHNLPPGTSSMYKDFLQSGCARLLDVGLLPVIEVGDGIATMGVGMFNGLLENSLNTILQFVNPVLLEKSPGLIMKIVKKILINDRSLQKTLMDAAEKDVEESIVSGAASRAGLGLAMAQAAVTRELGDKALAEGGEFVTLSTVKGMMWDSVLALKDFIPGFGQIVMLGMFLDMLDPCDLNSAMTGAQLQSMVNQMNASFRNTILETTESIPTSQNISVPFDEFPVTIDAFQLQEVADMMHLEQKAFGPVESGGEETATGGGQQLYLLTLYHRYVSLYLHNLKANANNDPITWAKNVPPTIHLSQAKTRLHTAFMTLTNDNSRAADLGVKYWYLALVFVLSFVGAVVLFLLS